MVRYVPTFENKYVQYMCKTSTWSIDLNNWEKINNEIYITFWGTPDNPQEGDTLYLNTTPYLDSFFVSVNGGWERVYMSGGNLAYYNGKKFYYNGTRLVQIADEDNLQNVLNYALLSSLPYNGEFVLNKQGRFLTPSIIQDSQLLYLGSDYIPVKKGDVFFLRIYGENNNTCAGLVFNESKEIIDTIPYNNSEAYVYLGDYEITQNGAAYVMFSTHLDDNIATYPYIIHKYTEQELRDKERKTLKKCAELAANFYQQKQPDSYSVIGLEQTDLYRNGAFVDNSFVEVPSNEWQIRKFDVTDDLLGFNVITESQTRINGYFVLDDDSKVLIVGTATSSYYNLFNLSLHQIKSIYVNVRIDKYGNVISGGAEQIELRFKRKSELTDDGKEILCDSSLVAVNKYLNDSGGETSLDGYFICRIPYDDKYDYFISETAVAGGVFGYNDVYLGKFTDFYDINGYVKKPMPVGAKYLLLTTSGIGRPYFKKLKDFYNKRYFTYLKKPFDFNGKTAVFFGDSITDGFVSRPEGQYHDFNKSWAKLLCDKLGMTATNQAVGGSSLAYNTRTDIPDYNQYSGVYRICSPNRYNITEDFIFIAHGSNDWKGAIPIGNMTDNPSSWDEATTFYGALNLVVSTIKTLYPTKTVIFVMPIWRRDDITLPHTYPLGAYRQAICDVALRNDINVVDGSQFGFPAGQDATIYDCVHPTELGYQIYAQQMYNLLQ